VSDRQKDFAAIAEGVKFGERSFRPIAVFDRHRFDVHVLVEGVDCHFRFDLKALGKNGEGLDEKIRESPITGHDVFDFAVEDVVDLAADQIVAKVVEGAFVFLKITAGKTISDHHVRSLFKNFPNHLWRAGEFVGVIAIHHQVAFRIDIAEH